MANSFQPKLKIGDEAPDFTALTSAGGTITLSSLRGKHVILYFYPRDNTPGCTIEACAFRDDFSAFSQQGAVILGVSTDSPKAHESSVKSTSSLLPWSRMKIRKLCRLTGRGVRKASSAANIWGPIA